MSKTNNEQNVKSNNRPADFAKERKHYNQPVLASYGTVSRLTAGAGTGSESMTGGNMP